MERDVIIWSEKVIMFVKASRRVGGVKLTVVYFGKLVYEQEFSLRVRPKSQKISSHPGRDMLKSVLKVRNA